ncbi:MAG: FAD-binding protein [Amaricoccus sp.]|uniref:FAD-binding protein n=1 Tax=Amaricoccus sp. TaxID=1872485 RepID=UPI0039E66D3D
MSAELAPESEAELAEMVRAAAAAGEALSIRGGGTRGIGGAVAGRPLSLARIAGITLYEPGALTLVARAGTPLAEVEAVLAAEGQRLAFEPWDGRVVFGVAGVPTVGGVAAVNASGPRRIEAGAARDSMIGVRFVDGSGAVVKNGGRVMKNVTGLDLVKLLAGSHGTLGILTEVAFKVLPAAAETATLVFDGHDLATAGRAMRAALATPYGVSGAAHADGRTLLRVEGFPASVAHRGAALATALARFGAARIEPGPGPWAAIRDAGTLAGREGALWRISVKPTDGPGVAASLAPAEVVLDWAGGLVWALAPEAIDVRARLGVPGHATLVRASAAAKARWGVFAPEPAPVAALSDGLRARFDPRGILNPGLMAARVGVAA